MHPRSCSIKMRRSVRGAHLRNAPVSMGGTSWTLSNAMPLCEHVYTRYRQLPMKLRPSVPRPALRNTKSALQLRTCALLWAWSVGGVQARPLQMQPNFLGVFIIFKYTFPQSCDLQIEALPSQPQKTPFSCVRAPLAPPQEAQQHAGGCPKFHQTRWACSRHTHAPAHKIATFNSHPSSQNLKKRPSLQPGRAPSSSQKSLKNPSPL